MLSSNFNKTVGSVEESSLEAQMGQADRTSGDFHTGTTTYMLAGRRTQLKALMLAKLLTEECPTVLPCV